MQWLLCALALSAFAIPVRAHPPVGIVMDPRGTVFFSDLRYVWQITPDGRKRIAVRGVHTHELAVDAAGNLYGGDSQYLGGDRYRHRVWRRSPEGRVSDVIPWRDGFWPAYGFVREAGGAHYEVSRPARRCTIRRRTASGRAEVFAPRAPLGDNVQWMAAAGRRSLYVIDRGALRHVSRTGQLRTVADRLGAHPMGLWSDTLRGSVYVAVLGARRVIRVDAAGRRSVVARSPDPWGPSGVLRAPDGALWILEVSTSHQVRVRRIGRDGRSRIF